MADPIQCPTGQVRYMRPGTNEEWCDVPPAPVTGVPTVQAAEDAAPRGTVDVFGHHVSVDSAMNIALLAIFLVVLGVSLWRAKYRLPPRPAGDEPEPLELATPAPAEDYRAERDIQEIILDMLADGRDVSEMERDADGRRTGAAAWAVSAEHLDRLCRAAGWRSGMSGAMLDLQAEAEEAAYRDREDVAGGARS